MRRAAVSSRRLVLAVACLASSPNGWSAMLGVASRPDGSFAVLVRPGWGGRRYRAALAGPNLGATLAPDAVACASWPS
jgi:hypothetical protein